LFNWLFRRRREPVAHHVWLNREAKLAGIRARIDRLLDNSLGPETVFVIAYFDESLAEIQRAINQQDRRLELISVAELQRRPRQMPETSRGIRVIVAELHPDIARDKELIRLAAEFECDVEIEFHASLNDAVMREFAGDWVANLLKQLGMSEHEPIIHATVTRQIESARKKLASRMISDHPADSAAAWIERNCRDA
jgi:hypothetical protein